MPLLQLTELNKVYRDGERSLTIIDKLSYEFPTTGSVAIVGRSGVGKSTLLHILAGLDSPTSGKVLLDGADIHAGTAKDRAAFRGRNIGFVFQFHHLLPEFSARENVAMPLIVRGVPPAEAYAVADAELEHVGLQERAEHIPGRLSGGEQQRVALARALVTRPSLILADEPTGNLDPESARSVTMLIKDVLHQSKALLLVVTHSLHLAKQMDSVLELRPGGMLVSHSENLDSAVEAIEQ